MRRMSFAMTTEQVITGTKDVTRRFGWWFLKPGDLIIPVRKAMGLKKGEKSEQLRAPIRVVNTRAEMLVDIDQADCIREGFPEMNPHQFICMLAKAYKNSAISYSTVNRIEFAYTDGDPRAGMRGSP